jgi:hypothetical protein
MAGRSTSLGDAGAPVDQLADRLLDVPTCGAGDESADIYVRQGIADAK